MPLTIRRIEDARQRIAGTAAVNTPLRISHALTRQLARPVGLNPETVQPTGAFKLPGPANAFLSLSLAGRERGVVTGMAVRDIVIAHLAPRRLRKSSDA